MQHKKTKTNENIRSKMLSKQSLCVKLALSLFEEIFYTYNLT